MDAINLPQAKLIIIKGTELSTGERDDTLRARQFYVQFSVDDTTRSTDLVEEEEQKSFWDDQLFFDVDDSSVFGIKVYQKDGRDLLVASLTDSFSGVLEKLVDGVFEGGMDITDESGVKQAWIKFTLGAEPHESMGAEALQTAYAVTEAAKLQVFETTWSDLLRRMELLSEIVADIHEVHLYTLLAWSVISHANQVLVSRKSRNDQMNRLASVMSDVLTFVHDAELSKTIKAHFKIVTLLIQQVTECGYFFTEYIRKRDIRKDEYSAASVDTIITNYEGKLAELKAGFLEGVTLQTGITVVHTMGVVEDGVDPIRFSDMPYAPDVGYDREKGCLPGTREGIIREICDVLNNSAEDAPRVCFLTGSAGSGKSAITHSIARLYDEQQRLGSSYYFSRTDPIRRNSQNLFSTIARDLSDHTPQYKSTLWQAVKDNRMLRTSTWPPEQVQDLIITHGASLYSVGTLVVIIDGLDESGDEDHRRHLLDALSKFTAKRNFPNNLHFLITARPEKDILDAVLAGLGVIHKDLGDIPGVVVDEDIGRFIYHSLRQHTILDSSFPDGDWCRLLVEHSRHLFLWASTVCRFIRVRSTAGLDLSNWLCMLLSDNDPGVYPPDKLYKSILEQQIKLHGILHQFHDVMAILLMLKEPLSLSSLSVLFGNRSRLQEVIKSLDSLLDGVYDEENPIFPHHSSFYEFLLDEAHSLTFHVHISPHHFLILGQALLGCMQQMLRFNIYNIMNSEPHIVAFSDLPHLVTKSIPPHLSYSCLHWMDHLQHTAHTPELMDEITFFFKNFFAYWLEVTSILSLSTTGSTVQSAQQTCNVLMTWAKGHEVATLAFVASQFIQVFAPILGDSFSHLLLSATPQTLPNSQLYPIWIEHLQQQFCTTQIASSLFGALKENHVLQGHVDFVRAVAYSPDGNNIVSGSWDKSIRIWDVLTRKCVAGPFHEHISLVESVTYSPDGVHIAIGCSDRVIRVLDATTGQLVMDPFRGHTKPIKSVAYSFDGSYIVSGSLDKTVRIWNAATGQCMTDPFQGHADIVNSVGCSPNGNHIVSGSHDHTIRVWDATTGKTITDPFQGHTYPVTSVCYSPDGKHIVSGSQDTTIRIWDAITGRCVIGPFWGHTKPVSSVAYSPDGWYIVSGSQDCTVRVWNAISGQCVIGSSEGHIHYVTSVAYSPDGKSIVSGSWDSIIRVWDVEMILGPFKGHIDPIFSIACSPDGKYIASGSDDTTVRVWNATTGQCVAGPFHGHTGNIYCVAYSSDGTHVASSSKDKTIRVWDATTGQCVAGPLQGHSELVICVAYSSDGIHIVSGSYDNTIRVWNLITGQCVVGPCQDHTEVVNSVFYSPDGRHIASGSGDQTIRIWDATTGQCVAEPFQHTDEVWSVAYSPDGTHIASGSKDQTLRIWDMITGQCVVKFEGHTAGVRLVSYSPDGRYVVSGSHDFTIRVWDISTGQCMLDPFRGHTSYVNSVAYLPNSTYIVSGSGDKTIRVWDATTGQCVIGPS